MPYATNQGLRIHYRVEGRGPDLVLQHGFTWNLDGWSRYGYVDALRASYRLILVDARGHGASDKPHESEAYALPLRAGDVVAVLDALDVRAAHFWGYSMGAWIGLGMAKHAPERVRSLVIGGTNPYAQPLPPTSRLGGSDLKAFIEDFVRRAGLDFASLPATKQAEFLDNDLQALTAAQDRTSVEDVLPRIRVPCLLYCGEADGYLPAMQKCVGQIPNARLVTFHGLNHPETFWHSEVVLPVAMKFLESES